MKKIMIFAVLIISAAVYAGEEATKSDTLFQENFETSGTPSMQRVAVKGEDNSPSVLPNDKTSKWVGLISGVNKIGYNGTFRGLKAGDKLIITVDALNDNAKGGIRSLVISAFIKTSAGEFSRRSDAVATVKGKWQTLKKEIVLKGDESLVQIRLSNGFKQPKIYVDNIKITVERADKGQADESAKAPAKSEK